MRPRIHNPWAVSFPVAALIILLSVSVQAQKAPAVSASDVLSARDPAAIALRDKVVRAYHDVRAIHEKIIQRQWKRKPEDALTIEIELRFVKPNRLYLAIDYPQVGKEGRWQLTYSCDGKTLTVYNGAKNEYQSVKSPAKLDRLVLPASLRGPEFVAILRDVNPFEDLEKSAIVKYTEMSEFDAAGRTKVLKLDLQQDSAKRSLRYRISPDDNLIHEFTLSIIPDADANGPFLDAEVPSTLNAKYTLVDTKPRFTDADFRIALPAGAREIKPDSPAASPGGNAPASPR